MAGLRISDYQVALADDVRLAVRHLRHSGADSVADTNDQLTLVLLHESLGSIVLWRDFPQQLAEATGADVLVYERRGYGGSSAETLPRPDDYLLQEGAIWLPRLVEALGLANVVLLGHSDGASVALIGAASLPRPRGLITLAAHVTVDELTIQGIREASQRYRSSDLPQRLARYHGERTEGLFNAWQHTWLRPSFQQSLDLTSWLGAIECPALILQGEQDEYGLPEQVSAIVAGIGAQAQGLFIAEARHTPHLEQPEAVVALVREFMDAITVDRYS